MYDRKEDKQLDFFNKGESKRRRRGMRLTDIPSSGQPASRVTYREKLALFSIVVFIVLLLVFILGVAKGRKTLPPEEEYSLRQSVKTPEKEPEVVKDGTENISAPPVDAKEPSSVTSPFYTVQVITISRKKNLLNEHAQRIEKMGYEPLKLTTRKYFVVCAGHFASREEAKKPLKILRDFYGDCFVRKLEEGQYEKP